MTVQRQDPDQQQRYADEPEKDLAKPRSNRRKRNSCGREPATDDRRHKDCHTESNQSDLQSSPGCLVKMDFVAECVHWRIPSKHRLIRVVRGGIRPLAKSQRGERHRVESSYRWHSSGVRPLVARAGLARTGPRGQRAARRVLASGFLGLLEALNPVERAVHLLHEACGYRFAEIAELLGRTEVGCRQAATRARQRLTEWRADPPDPGCDSRAVDAFVVAARRGAVEEMSRLLVEDVALWADGGGQRRAPHHPIQGRAQVVRFLVGISRLHPDARVRRIRLNGQEAGRCGPEACCTA
jgi:Sigma-70, region 4